MAKLIKKIGNFPNTLISGAKINKAMEKIKNTSPTRFLKKVIAPEFLLENLK